MLTRRFAAVALFAALSFVVAGPRVAVADPDALEGKEAPDVAVKTLDGKDVKLSDMKGKVVVMDFWATWCPPCRESLPHVQQIAADKALADKGLVVWAVNAHEKPETVKSFVEKNKFTFTVPMGTAAGMQEYQIRGIPTTIIVGRDGKVAKTFVGFGPGSAKALDEAVEAELAKK